MVTIFLYYLQTRMSLALGSYRGISHCLASVYKQEGAKALFAGLVPSIVGIFPYAGVDLAVNSVRCQIHNSDRCVSLKSLSNRSSVKSSVKFMMPATKLACI